MGIDLLKRLSQLGDLAGLASALAKHFPRGLLGEREAMVTFLTNEVGLPHPKAVEIAEALEASGHAHHLPGQSPRWIFTSEPVSLRALMRKLDEEYHEFIGEGDADPREEALTFIGGRLGVDRRVAEEILEGLEAAGYASLAEGAASNRDRFAFNFPEAFVLTYRV